MNKEQKYRAYMRKAYELSKSSPDPSTKNGAMLISEDGHYVTEGDFNRFPEGVVYTQERWTRPLKYKIIEHAERNVIYKAAKNGFKTKDLTMVCPWAPCTDCARAIIQSGIKRLVTHIQAHNRTTGPWSEDIKIALVMLKEAGVEVVWFDGKVGVVRGVLHSGETWDP